MTNRYKYKIINSTSNPTIILSEFGEPRMKYISVMYSHFNKIQQYNIALLVFFLGFFFLPVGAPITIYNCQQRPKSAWAIRDLFHYFFINRARPFGCVNFAWLTESVCDSHLVDNNDEFVSDPLLLQLSLFLLKMDLATQVRCWVTCWLALIKVPTFIVFSNWYLFNKKMHWWCMLISVWALFRYCNIK